MTHNMARPLTGPVETGLPGADVLRGHGLLGMGPCSTITILCHRLTDLVTLSLGLGVGRCDEEGQQQAQSLHAQVLWFIQR